MSTVGLGTQFSLQIAVTEANRVQPYVGTEAPALHKNVPSTLDTLKLIDTPYGKKKLLCHDFTGVILAFRYRGA